MEPQLDGDSDGWCVSHPLAFGIYDTSWQSDRNTSETYCRSDRPNNVYWAMDLVRGYPIVRGQGNIDVEARTSK